MTPVTLGRTELNRATLARQMLLEREPVSAVAAIERLAGMQAQEPKHPFIGLWTRVEGFDREQLLRALNRREVVRATLMRSTLHLMSAADYAALRMALQPSMAIAKRVLGVAGELDVDAVLPAARELLRGRALAFDDIRAGLQQSFPDVDQRALGYAVRTLLPLVMVPSATERWGFARAADFAPAGEWLDEPLAEPDAEALVTRYLGAFGPASAEGCAGVVRRPGDEGGARRHARPLGGVRRRARARALRPARCAASRRRRPSAAALVGGVRQPRPRIRRPHPRRG